MAKKKKSGDGEKSEKPATPAAAAATPDKKETDIDIAYARGNYARVRELAKTDPSEHAQKVKALVEVDPVQILVGAGAILVVALAAFLTLH
jgi:hypothetical protein